MNIPFPQSQPKLEERSFKYWTKDATYRRLGLKRLDQSHVLDQWMQAEHYPDPAHEKMLRHWCEKANRYIDGWNEAELWIKLIAPIIELVDFDMPELFISSFAQRDLQVNTEQFILNGRVDWMLASGESEPGCPFFFIHEYKREQGTSNDPRGQLLSAMYAAFVLHQLPPDQAEGRPPLPHYYKDIPIYGAYVIGRMWFFAILLPDKTCCFSRAFLLTDRQDLTRVFSILKKTKAIIREWALQGDQNPRLPGYPVGP